MAQALYLKYCRDHNPQALADIYQQEDDFNAQAAEYLRDSLQQKVIQIINFQNMGHNIDSLSSTVEI